MGVDPSGPGQAAEETQEPEQAADAAQAQTFTPEMMQGLLQGLSVEGAFYIFTCPLESSSQSTSFLVHSIHLPLWRECCSERGVSCVIDRHSATRDGGGAPC